MVTPADTSKMNDNSSFDKKNEDESAAKVTSSMGSSVVVGAKANVPGSSDE